MNTRRLALILPSVAAALLVASGSGLHAQEVVRRIDLSESVRQGRIPEAVALEDDARGGVRILNTNALPLRVHLLTLENPGVTGPRYALRGEVRYDQVVGEGFLEMWSVFPSPDAGGPEARYFSRTRAASGEMGRLAGTSDWRPFLLPFHMAGAKADPVRLELNLELPSSGDVRLRSLELLQWASPGGWRHASSPGWWTSRASGLIGGIGGALIGVFGGLLGWLAQRGRAAGFVTRSMAALIVLGALLGVAAFVAAALRQPFHVWALLALASAILLSTMPIRLRQCREQYAQLELRRIRAADLASL